MLEGLFIAGAAQQLARSNQAQTTGELAGRIAADVRTQNEAITADVEKLFMIVQSLWMILKEEHGYSDEDLQRRIEAIDLEDGRLDGKVAKTMSPDCPHCGRKLMRKKPVCLYCGGTVMRDPFER